MDQPWTVIVIRAWLEPDGVRVRVLLGDRSRVHEQLLVRGAAGAADVVRRRLEQLPAATPGRCPRACVRTAVATVVRTVARTMTRTVARTVARTARS